jgi:apolipoprotein N-acyltransferase
MLVAAVSRPPRIAFGWGWLAGLVFFMVLLRWLNFTFRVYTAMPWPVSLLPTLALAGYCGLYFALVACAVAWITARRSPTWALAAAPFLWIAAEWGRGRILGGFPWGTLGYTQYQHLPVIQVAELGGVHAVSFVVIAVNVAFACALVLSWRRAVLALALAGVLVLATLQFGWSRLRETWPQPEVTVAVVQPAIDQPLKWDPEFAERTLAISLALTQQAGAVHPDLTVWPETSTPTPVRRDPGLLATLRDLATAYRMPLLVGSIDLDDRGGLPRNSAFLLTEQGIVGRYDKIHLVPFGEYVPLSRLIGFVRGWAEFIADLEPGSQPVVFAGPPAPFGVVICYEGIFPELFRDFVRRGARLMVNMTNDAWFGRTSGPVQHLAMYAFRAIEHRISVVRVANTGVSAFIAPSGQMIRRLGLYARGMMAERVPLRVGQTLYGRIGEWVVWVSLAASAAGLGGAWMTRRERRAR